MAMIRAVLHTYPGVPDDPPEVLHHINRHFRFLWETAMYATAVYAVSMLPRDIRLSSAGHPPPLLLRPGHAAGALPIDTTTCLLWDELREVPSSNMRSVRAIGWCSTPTASPIGKRATVRCPTPINSPPR